LLPRYRVNDDQSRIAGFSNLRAQDSLVG
jgi:hypothetical protein